MNDERRELQDDHDTSVAAQLREEMVSSTDPQTPVAPDDLRLVALLANLSEKELGDCQHPEADDFLARGETLEASVRARLIDGATRGLQHRRRKTHRLQTYLEHLRAEARISVADVANALGMTENEVLAVERGSKPLLAVDPSVIAKWARWLGGDAENVIRALRRSLGLGQGALTYSQRDQRLSPEASARAEEYLQKVKAELTSG